MKRNKSVNDFLAYIRTPSANRYFTDSKTSRTSWYYFTYFLHFSSSEKIHFCSCCYNTTRRIIRLENMEKLNPRKEHLRDGCELQCKCTYKLWECNFVRIAKQFDAVVKNEWVFPTSYYHYVLVFITLTRIQNCRISKN